MIEGRGKIKGCEFQNAPVLVAYNGLNPDEPGTEYNSTQDEARQSYRSERSRRLRKI